MSKIKMSDVVFYEGFAWVVVDVAKDGKKGFFVRNGTVVKRFVSLEGLKPLTCKNCIYCPQEKEKTEVFKCKRGWDCFSENSPACGEFDCLQCKDCFIYDWVEDCCMKYGTKNCGSDFPCNDFSGPKYAIEETESLR